MLVLCTYLVYNTVVQLCQFFWLWREIVLKMRTRLNKKKVFGVMYVLSVQYSCAVVSVFLLWREIVLKMRTGLNKKILLGYFL